MADLTPEKLIVARALDVLTSLSPEGFKRLRAGKYQTYDAKVPAFRLKALAEAIEAVYPGVIDKTYELERGL